MRLICPNCGTQYEVADAAIPEAGRDVQCGSCQTVWFQSRSIPEPEAGPDEREAPEEEMPEDDDPQADPDEDPFTAISRRIQREAEALDRSASRPVQDVPAPRVVEEGLPGSATAVDTGSVDRASAERESETAADTSVVHEPDDMPEPPSAAIETLTVAAAPGPAEPSPEEVTAAFAEIARPDAPRPSASISGTETGDPDAGRRPGVLNAVSATVAASGAFSEQTGNSLAERLKRRVAEAAEIRGSAKRRPDDQQIFGASSQTVMEAASSPVQSRFPDADTLASSLRDAREEQATGARSSGFWRGFGAAVGVAACFALLYVTAPAISGKVPALAPALTSYVAAVDGLRVRIGG